MRERALLIGGHLNIFSAPGQGTTIELTMGAT
jgi:two-component system sensor histidine kinase UhpB